jgi:hypothetical protein
VHHCQYVSRDQELIKLLSRLFEWLCGMQYAFTVIYFRILIFAQKLGQKDEIFDYLCWIFSQKLGQMVRLLIQAKSQPQIQPSMTHMVQMTKN